MSNTNEPVTVATLAAFSAAWNRHDIDSLMGFMSDDCIFQTAAGSESYGTRHIGKSAVRAAFESAWINFPDAQWIHDRHLCMRTSESQSGLLLELQPMDRE